MTYTDACCVLEFSYHSNINGCAQVPHDAPESAQAMLEQWVLAVLQGAGQTELTASLHAKL